MKYLLFSILPIFLTQCYIVSLDPSRTTYIDDTDYSYTSNGFDYDRYLGTWEKGDDNLFLTFYSDNSYIACSYETGYNKYGYIISSSGIFNLFENRLVLIDDVSGIHSEYTFDLYGGSSILNQLPGRQFDNFEGRWDIIGTITKYGWMDVNPRPRPPARPPIISHPLEPIVVKPATPPKDNRKPRPQIPNKNKPVRETKKEIITPPKSSPDQSAKKKKNNLKKEYRMRNR